MKIRFWVKCTHVIRNGVPSIRGEDIVGIDVIKKISILFVGELNPKDLFETTLNPENFKLTRIVMKDRSKTDEVISGIMGNDSSVRKEMIRRM